MSSTTPVNSAHGKSPWSLAGRLTLWYTLSAFALVALSTSFLYVALAISLDRQNDRFLEDEIHILRGHLRDRPHDVNALKQDIEWESGSREKARLFVRVLDEQGQTNLETPGMNSILPPSLFPAAIPNVAASLREMNIVAPSRDGAAYTFRICSARAVVGQSTAFRVLQVALDRTQEERLLAEFRGYAIVIMIVALLACAAAGYHIARRGTRPIQEITNTTQRIRSSTLNERVVLPGLPAELSLLADMFNEMLDRLEKSFTRLSRFSADIAHELRTPVNNLRGEIEVALGKPRAPDEYRDVLGSCLEECGRLAQMINSLLFLARAENPEIQIEREGICLLQELEIVREFYDSAAHEAGVRLTIDCPPDIRLNVDHSLWQRAVGNLVENALRHTPRDGHIRVIGSQTGEYAEVTIADTGCGIGAEHLPHVFDRFYRVDEARTRGGIGLGLAIVKTITELHGGQASIESFAGRGTNVTLRFPSGAGTRPR